MMYPKRHTPKQSRFQFALEGVGSFSPPKRSIFNEDLEEEEEDEGKADETFSPTRQDAVKEEEDIIIGVPCEVNELQKQQEREEEERRKKEAENKVFLRQYGIKVIQDETEQNHTQTTTKTSGRIQFTNIVVPPDAPKDLICEECEQRFSSYYCSACRQVFCYQCADLCHPRVSANTLQHEHEADGFIRAVRYGDVSKVKLQNEFYLPDHEVYPEEFARVKALEQPNTLLTNPTSAKRFVLQPSRQLAANKPLYKVNDLVLFKDPVTAQKAYGKVISEYDELNGKVSAPAIFRGEDSNRYYMVQMIDLLVHTDELQTILLQDEHYLEEEKKKKRKEKNKSKPFNPDKRKNHGKKENKSELNSEEDRGEADKGIDDEDEKNTLIPELSYDCMKDITDKILILNQRIQEYSNRILLGPKYHLRNLNFPKGIPFPINPGPPEGDNDAHSMASSVSSHASQAAKSGPSFLPLIQIPNQKQSSSSKPYNSNTGNIRAMIHKLNQDENSDTASSASSYIDDLDVNKLHFHRHSISQLSLDQQVSFQNIKKQREKFMLTSSSLQQLQLQQKRKGKLLDQVAGKTDERKSLEVLSDITAHDYQNDAIEFAERSDGTYANKLYYQQQSRHHQRDFHHLPPIQQHLKRFQQQYQKDMQQVSQEKRIDYDLYANINNLDDDSVLSYYNQHQLALPALHRSPEDYVMQSTIDAYKTSHYFPNLPNAQIPSRMFAEQLTKEISTKLLNILLLPEKDIETTFVQYLEDLQQKKKSLLNNVFSKTELIYLKAEVFMKFQYWKKVIRYEKRQKYILAAKKIQRNVRVWLCRNVLDDLRLYYHNIEVEKHRTLHRKFRYCGPDHPYAVSVDGKLFFETHADLNRYIYFIRVMILKVIKYLTIKKLNFYQTVFKIWKSAIYEFKESDMTNQHISTELVHLDRAASSAANVPMEELKKLYISEQEQLLYRLLTKNPEDRPRPMRSRNMEETTGVDNELFANLPLNPFPTSPPMKNSSSSPTASPLINSKNQQDKENEWGVLITPTIQFIKNYSEYKRKVLMKNRNIIDEKRLLEEKIEKPAIYHNQSFLIDNESNDNEQSNVKQIILSQQQEKNEENVKLNFPLPSYNPSFNLPLPILPIFTRGANFHDRLYYDVIQQQQPSSTLNTLESLYYNPSLVNAYQREYRMYKHQLEGPTSESYWLIPSILMIGNVPFGPAIKKRFDAVPPNFHDSLSTTSFLDGNKSKQLKDSSKLSTNNSSSRWKSNSNELTAISALLLAGIDTFVSMLSEKEENILQSYYQSEYTIETMIHTALEHTKTLSNRIIADHLLLIQKQEQQLLMIPTFGKSDPRYPQAYQEKLRCQGRITFYQNVINTIKNQIKLLPKELYFYRLVNNNIPSNYKPIPNSQPSSTLSPSHATSEDGTDLPSNMPWTTSQILPSVWFIEQLIRDSHTIYLYSGSYHHQKEDGPTKDGLSGTIGSIVMGRLYHLKGLDAIFQWQKCHDFMQILQLHEPKHSMTNPFLPEKIKKQFKKTAALNNEGHDGEDGVDGEVEKRTGKRLFQEELEKYQKSQQWKIKNLLPSEITHNSKEEREKEEDRKENTIPTRQVAATSKELAELSLRRLQDHLDGKVNPTIEILQKHGESYLYRTSCPPTAWQKSLILDCLTFSHEWINYPIVRSQITPEIYTILERNHYDITLRNQNLSLESLQDYYTSQQYLPISLNNTANYSNFITDEKSKRNLIRSTTNHHTMNQTSMMKIPSTSSISSSSSFSINTESSKSHGMSGKGTIKQLHSKDVIIRGDVIQEEENEEDDKINSIGAFSVNSTASMKSSSMKGRAAIMVPKTGKAPRMTMLQRMKQQVAEEELAEEQRLEKERLEKEAFESKEFNEAQRQEMIMTKLPVQRIQQSVYQQPPQQGLPRQQTASTIVTGRVLSSRSTSSKYSK